MSLAQAIRGAITGGLKPGMESGDPEDDEVIEDDAPEDEAGPAAEGDEPDDDPQAEGDDADEDDDTMSASERAAHAQGRRAEQARMAAILGSEAAEVNPTLAAHLAFNTAMSAKDALAALKAGGTPAASGRLRDRVGASAGQKPLGNGGKNGAQARSASDRRADARAGYLAGLSNRKRKEG